MRTQHSRSSELASQYPVKKTAQTNDKEILERIGAWEDLHAFGRDRLFLDRPRVPGHHIEYFFVSLTLP